MKKISAIVIAAAMLLALAGCDGENSSALSDGSDTSQSGSDVSSDSGDSGLSSMSEWEYASLVRDNYEKYFIASSSPNGDLPNVSNNLIVPSLETAIEDDKTGQVRALAERFCAEQSLSERIEITDEILQHLCQTDSITNSGDFFSSKKLAILEDFWGTGETFPEPTSEITAQPLEEAYSFLAERYCMAMIGSLCLPYIDLITGEQVDGSYRLNMESYNERVFEDFASGALSKQQLFDNALYLTYYGVMRDENLTMKDSFRAYAVENAPQAVSIIDSAVNEAADLFSGINGVVITHITVNPADSSAPTGESSAASSGDSTT